MAQPSGQATPTQAAPPEAAAPAQSTPASPAATSPQAAAKPKRLGDRVICKEETILGTRLKTLKTCRTANEWRRIQRGFQAEMKTFTDRGAAASINGN
ncbi:hypothetical protein [Candidatus Phycosocius bacilliformis]|nr:hypothetical protein [Candidatus Phycosocius bacilliformis]